MRKRKEKLGERVKYIMKNEDRKSKCDRIKS